MSQSKFKYIISALHSLNPWATESYNHEHCRGILYPAPRMPAGYSTLQNLPSSERHIPSNPQRRVGEVGTTAWHHSTTRNFV